MPSLVLGSALAFFLRRSLQQLSLRAAPRHRPIASLRRARLSIALAREKFALELGSAAVRIPVVTVKHDDLMLAFDFVGSAPPMEHNAYISRDTGKIYWTSEMNPMEDDLSDDFDTSDRYIAIPHKNALNLGRNLALDFVDRELPDRHAEARDIFRHRGPYRRFKEFLDSERLLEKWYKFEADSVEKALTEWCAENDIRIVKE